MINKNKRRKRKLTPFGKFLFLTLFILLLLLIWWLIPDRSSESAKKNNIKQDQPIVAETDDIDTTKNYIPRAKKTADTKTLQTNSEYGILINLDTNEIIAERNSDTKIFPASLTKVMTLIVAVENIKDFEDTFTFSYELTDPAFEEGASVAGFKDSEEVPMIDVLYGAILPSGADATAAIAEYVAGGEEEFVKLMNEKAEELGLKNTHFVNCSGLHDDNHYSTVHEIALIMEYAMNNKKCSEILSEYEYTTTATSQNPDGITLYSNTFEKMYGTEAEGVTIKAGKTGYTTESGNCLVTYAESDNGERYILATANAEGTYKPIYDAINTYAEHVGTGETSLNPDIS